MTSRSRMTRMLVDISLAATGLAIRIGSLLSLQVVGLVLLDTCKTSTLKLALMNDMVGFCCEHRLDVVLAIADHETPPLS